MLLKAPRERVWDAITKPELMTKWFSTSIDASSLAVGQEFRLDWPEYNAYARAVVVEMTPTTRFAYRWENGDGDHSAPLANTPTTLVTFDLEEISVDDVEYEYDSPTLPVDGPDGLLGLFGA